MRELTGHKVNPANDVLKVFVMDEPGDGGACHEYQVQIPGKNEDDPIGHVTLNFQNGPINLAGVNGITHEVLLAILVDRLEGFQSGKFYNNWNKTALGHLQSAQAILLDRTRERMARNVEGTHEL